MCFLDLFFIPSVRPGLRGHSFKVLQVLVGAFAEILPPPQYDSEQASYLYCCRPFRQLVQTPTGLDVEGFVFRSPVTEKHVGLTEGILE